MHTIKKAIHKVLHNRGKLGLMVLPYYSKLLSDKKHIELYYKYSMGKKLNLKTPQTFNEKLNWLKLYDRNPLYTTLVDKYAVKPWVSERIGEQYIIPTLGVWNSFDDIVFDKLPKQFVLKTTHGGGNTGVVICKDKSTFNIEEAKRKIERSMKTSGYDKHREWPYKNVPRRIIAEQFISPSSGEDDLPDYKFFCFDGQVKALFIATDRSSGDVKFDFFDADFNHLDLYQRHPMSNKPISKPASFEEMKSIAACLSRGLPEARVDLYNVNGKVYFGEITFFHHAGVVPFHPDKWDYIFGSWITLPAKKL